MNWLTDWMSCKRVKKKKQPTFVGNVRACNRHGDYAVVFHVIKRQKHSQLYILFINLLLFFFFLPFVLFTIWHGFLHKWYNLHFNERWMCWLFISIWIRLINSATFHFVTRKMCKMCKMSGRCVAFRKIGAGNPCKTS